VKSRRRSEARTAQASRDARRYPCRVPNETTESSWDERLLPLLTDQWQSADALAARLKARPFTVLARLKDMMRRNLVERRIVNNTSGKMHAGRPLQQAEFRRTTP
jgi:predicted ArsR family transcriptional regulator